MKKISKNDFFKKLAGVIDRELPNKNDFSNSVIAFFIEDFFLELEEKNEKIEEENEDQFKKISKMFLQKFTNNRHWVPVLDLEIKYQQKIISILSGKVSENVLTSQITELESLISVIQINKNSKNLKHELDKLTSLIVKYMQVQETLTFDGFITKLDINQNNDVCVKTLESALPFEEMSHFSFLEFSKKKMHLIELHLIHVGIRVFKNEYEEAKTMIGQELQKEKKKNDIPFLNEFCEEMFQVEQSNLVRLINDIEMKDCSEIDFNEQIEVKLIWQKFIQIKNFLETEFEVFLNLRNKGHSEMERLIGLASKPNQALKNVIFPIFSQLGQTYKALLASRTKICKLFDFVASYTTLIDSKVEKLNGLVMNSHFSGLDELENLKNDRFQLVNVEKVYLENIKLMFNGICLVSLVCDGLILYGNPNEAVLYDKTKNIYLCFFSLEKAHEFLKGPDQVYEHVNQALLDYKMLIFLVDYDHLQKYLFFIETINDEIRDEHVKCFNVAIQTPVHWIDRFIDHNYFWNEWDLRRQAIKMANIRNKKTIGCQTGNSYFKVNNETQIWPMKDEATMTEVERGTNPIWPKNYIVGLRSIENK